MKSINKSSASDLVMDILGGVLCEEALSKMINDYTTKCADMHGGEVWNEFEKTCALSFINGSLQKIYNQAREEAGYPAVDDSAK